MIVQTTDDRQISKRISVAKVAFLSRISAFGFPKISDFVCASAATRPRAIHRWTECERVEKLSLNAIEGILVYTRRSGSLLPNNAKPRNHHAQLQNPPTEVHDYALQTEIVIHPALSSPNPAPQLAR